LTTELATIQFRRGTAAQWATSNPILSVGEPGYEVDTGKFKIGNGGTAWTALPYEGGGAVSSDLSAIAIANPTAADVPMNGHKITGLAPGTASTDAATFGQITGGSTTLAGLTDVSETSPSDGQVLTYVTAASKWENRAAAGGAPTTAQLAAAMPYAVDLPENHGAKRDGTVLTGVTITHSSNTLTCSTAAFVSGDVGKHVMVCNPSTGTTLITTVSSVTDSHNVVLASTTADFASTFAVYGTDDTAAIQAAIDSADAAAVANGSYYYEVWFSRGIYMVSGAPSTGRSGNAQVTLPVHAVGPMKMVCVLRGVSEGSALPHWQQTSPQAAGAFLCSTYNSGTNSAGAECVVGGPNVFGGYGPANANLWSNMMVVIDGLGVMLPRDPAVAGVDLIGVAEANVKSLGVMCFTVPSLESAGGGYQSSSWSFGLQMPGNNNNDHNEIGQYSCESVCLGVVLGEHTVANSIRAIYCADGIVVSQFQPLNHGAVVNYASVEACYNCLYSDDGGCINVNMLDEENTGHALITDVSNTLTGQVFVHRAGATPIDSAHIIGCKYLKIFDSAYGPGAMASPPSVPASGSPSAPVYRDAFVAVTGGSVTAVSVDGGAWPPGQPFAVPTGKSVTVTYTGTLTWEWVIL